MDASVLTALADDFFRDKDEEFTGLDLHAGVCNVHIADNHGDVVFEIRSENSSTAQRFTDALTRHVEYRRRKNGEWKYLGGLMRSLRERLAKEHETETRASLGAMVPSLPISQEAMTEARRIRDRVTDDFRFETPTLDAFLMDADSVERSDLIAELTRLLELRRRERQDPDSVV